MAPAALPLHADRSQAGIGIDPAHGLHFRGRRRNDDAPWLRVRAAYDQHLPGGGGATRRETLGLNVVRVDSSRRVPGGEAREQDGEVGARLLAERRCEHVVERRGRRVRRAECAEHDVDGIVRLVVEHLQPSELCEDGIDVGAFARGREGVRDRPAHRLLHHGAFVGGDHSSLPSSRSRRAMMLRCTSAVPP